MPLSDKQYYFILAEKQWWAAAAKVTEGLSKSMGGICHTTRIICKQSAKILGLLLVYVTLSPYVTTVNFCQWLTDPEQF